MVTTIFLSKTSVEGCGGMLNGTSGTFRSPGYLTQLKYDDNLDCSWTLLIPSDGHLTLIFVEFETEECCDFVTLTDSVGKTIATLSGDKQNYEVAVNGSTTQLVKVTFTSDSSVRRRGFLAQYLIELPPSSSSVMSSSPMVTSSTSVTEMPSLSSPAHSVMSHLFISSSTASLIPAMSSPTISENQSSSFTGILTSSSPTSSQNQSMSATEQPTLSSAAPSILSSPPTLSSLVPSVSSSSHLMSTLVTELPILSSTPFTTLTVEPSSVTFTPVTSSSRTPELTLPPEVQTVLVNLLSSVSQIILRLQTLLQGPISPEDFANFRNETIDILKQIENSLAGPTTSPANNRQMAKRDIREFPDTRELLELLNKIHQKLLA